MTPLRFSNLWRFLSRFRGVEKEKEGREGVGCFVSRKSNICVAGLKGKEYLCREKLLVIFSIRMKFCSLAL